MTATHPDEPVFDAHPTLGKYAAHHPSRRMWLLLRGAAFYAIPVGLLQLLTLDVTDAAAQLFLPAIYAAVGLAVAWYVAHFWNREIVLYRGGFTYREGSRVADFRYGDVSRVSDHTETIRVFGVFPWTRYRYIMITHYDETLRVTNLYAETRSLVDTLDKRITRAQLPLAQATLEAGEAVAFGEGLRLSRDGLATDEAELFWHELAGYRVREGRLLLLRGDDSAWAAIPVRQLHNVVLLLALLKEHAPRDLPKPPATENANAS